MDAQTILERLNACSIPVSIHEAEQLAVYHSLLLDWNTRMDLTAVTEDSEMLDFVQKNLSKMSSLAPNNVYETLVTRNMAQEKMAMDGWIVLTQYNGGSDFYHCIFYFMITSD